MNLISAIFIYSNQYQHLRSDVFSYTIMLKPKSNYNKFIFIKVKIIEKMMKSKSTKLKKKKCLKTLLFNFTQIRYLHFCLLRYYIIISKLYIIHYYT